MKSPLTFRQHLAALSDDESTLREARRCVDDRKRAIGEACRRQRRAQRVTLREMARRCDVSPAMLSDFEYGRRWSDRLVAELLKVLK